MGLFELNNVSRFYQIDKNKKKYVLKDVSLNIPAGKFVVISGSSGCGKSTLVRLLLGFEKPLEGKVMYDGIDIQDYDLYELRNFEPLYHNPFVRRCVLISASTHSVLRTFRMMTLITSKSPISMPI